MNAPFEQTRNVVITGAGPVSALGFGMEEHEVALRQGRSGIDEITLFDPEPYGSYLAGEVPEFDVEDYIDSQKTYLDRSAEVAFAAIRLAIADAGLDPAGLREAHAGISLGSAFGSQSTTELFYHDLLEKGPRLVKPILFPNAYPNTTISLLAIEYGLDGMHLNFANGFLSSASAITAAYDHIRQGKASLVFAGGYDVLSESMFYGFEGTNRLSPNDGGEETCRPFDAAANGFIAGEGATIFVLEDEEHAKRRNAPIRAQLAGCDQRSGLPSAYAEFENVGRNEGCNMVEESMKGAVRAGQGSELDIDCIFAHANGERRPEEWEAEACLALSNRRQDPVPVTTSKPFTGECIGAGGAVQTAAALTALEDGCIPQVVNLEKPKDLAQKLDVVTAEPRRGSFQDVLVNNIDAGGSAVSMLLRKPYQ